MLRNVAAKSWFLRPQSTTCRLYCTNYDELKHLISEESSEPDFESEHDFLSCPKVLETTARGKSERPMRYMLATTNKMLFGPLLETKTEKTRRIKRELKKGKLANANNKGKLVYDASLETSQESYSQDDSHYHYMFGGNASKLSLSQYDAKTKMNNASQVRTSVIRKMPKLSYMDFGSNDSKINTNKCKKIIQLTGNSSENITTTMKVKPKPKEKQPKESLFVNSLPENIELSSEIIYIDNSKFTAAPDTIDLNAIRTFPLYHTNLSPLAPPSTLTPPSTLAPPSTHDGTQNITTIGMFDGGYQKLPSVRKILDETMPAANRIALERWKAKMIKQLGEEGFEEYRQGLLNNGKLLHGCIQAELSGDHPSTDQTQAVDGFWASIGHVLPGVTQVQVLESRLVHPYMYYQGAVDCIGVFKGMPVLVEWKTSGKPKLSLKSMFDDPLQVVAYLGAFNYDANYAAINTRVESAMLVVAYSTGLPAHVHVMRREQCEQYWRVWCARLAQFWGKLSTQAATH